MEGSHGTGDPRKGEYKLHFIFDFEMSHTTSYPPSNVFVVVFVSFSFDFVICCLNARDKRPLLKVMSSGT